jgi:hypothetical protein
MKEHCVKITNIESINKKRKKGKQESRRGIKEMIRASGK